MYEFIFSEVLGTQSAEKGTPLQVFFENFPNIFERTFFQDSLKSITRFS